MGCLRWRDSGVMTTIRTRRACGAQATPVRNWQLAFTVVLAVVIFLLAQDMVYPRFSRGGWVNRLRRRQAVVETELGLA